MYLLSKNELRENQLYLDAKGSTLSLRGNNDNFLLIENPVHLKYLNNVLFENYNYVYDVTDYVSLKLNNELSRFLKIKNDIEMKNILIANYYEDIKAKDMISEIIENTSFKTFKIDKSIDMLKNLMNTIFYTDKEPNTVIYEIKNKISNIDDDYERLLYETIFSQPVRKLTFIILLNKFREMRKVIKTLNRKEGKIADCLNHIDCKIVFSNVELSPIINNKDFKFKRSISILESFNMLYFKNVENIISKLKYCKSRNKHIYLVRNGIVYKKLTYLDILKLKNGNVAFELMLNVFNESELDKSMIDDNLLDYLSKKEYFSILNILNKKYNVSGIESIELEDEQLYSKSTSILDIINENYA